jgi:hypothetical protein
LAQKPDCEVLPKATPVKITRTTIEAPNSSSFFISKPNFFSLKIANEVDFVIDFPFFGGLTGSKAFSFCRVLINRFENEYKYTP